MIAGKRLDIRPGDRFDRFTIIQEVEQRSGKRMFLCKCDCGNEKIVRLEYLRSGHSKSCGCYISDKNRAIKTKHGLYGSRLYEIWKGMKKRCFNPKCSDYESYGGRGVTVCEEWLEFKPFYEWATNNGYNDALSIDRIDVNGNYEPSNCKWSTREEQQNNTRRNKVVSYNNQEKTLTEWALELGIKYNVLQLRLSRGWPIEKAFTTSVQTNLKKVVQ